MYQVRRLPVLFDVLRNGLTYRSFTVRSHALSFYAAARELCPDDKWEFVEIFEDEVTSDG